MNYEAMTTAEMIEQFEISRAGDKLRVENLPDVPEVRVLIVRRKPEIMAYLRRKEDEEKAALKAARDERQAKINAIEGLAEITAAIEDMRSWREEFTANMERGDSGVGLRAKPEYDLDALNAKYPRAAAYRKAQAMSLAEHYVKSGAGRKALEKIINGEDYEAAIAEAEKEWSDYCSEHIWD